MPDPRPVDEASLIGYLRLTTQLDDAQARALLTKHGELITVRKGEGKSVKDVGDEILKLEEEPNRSPNEQFEQRLYHFKGERTVTEVFEFDVLIDQNDLVENLKHNPPFTDEEWQEEAEDAAHEQVEVRQHNPKESEEGDLETRVITRS